MTVHAYILKKIRIPSSKRDVFKLSCFKISTTVSSIPPGQKGKPLELPLTPASGGPGARESEHEVL